MQRFGRVALLRAGAEEEYDRLHAAVWPDVLAALQTAGLRNYTIYRHGRWLFSHFELPTSASVLQIGSMLAAHETCRRWESLMHTLQTTLPQSGTDSWWVPMREIFHFDPDTHHERPTGTPCSHPESSPDLSV